MTNSDVFEQLKSEIDALRDVEGLNMADLLEFPAALRRFLSWVIRKKKVQLDDVAAYLGQDEASSKALMDLLIEKGLIEEIRTEQEEEYQVAVISSRNYRVPKDIWQAIE